MAAMHDLAYWTTKLKEAERVLEAATTCSAVDLAARRLIRVKAELKARKREDTCSTRCPV
jgi:hypothetical protein